MKLWLPISLAVLGWAAVVWGRDVAPVIEVSEGKVKGEDKESREDKDFFAYRGIPYAQPPVGPLRFEPPHAPSNWSGVKDAEDYEKRCLQYDSFAKKVVGNEDCLYLNVFTPRFGDGISKTMLPVLVYIHGGFFMSGTANENKPHYFMDHQVVMVTFNYRVGALGFLNTQDGNIRGNMGLKDQVMALRWVQKNIRKFGGDPNKVTIFGEGAGASSVHYHMLSPMSKNLFQKAISQGGTALNVYAYQPRPVEAALRLAGLLNCNEVIMKDSNSTMKEPDVFSNSSLLLHCLKKVDAKKIAEVHKETWNPLRHPLSVFVPSVEITHKEANDTFMAEHPFSLLIRGKQRRIPWMTGYNSEEGLHVAAKILHTKDFLDIAETRWKENSGKFLVYDNSRTDITEALWNYYIQPQESPALMNPPTTTTTTTTSMAAPVKHNVPGGPGVPRPQTQTLYPTLPPLPQMQQSMTVVPIIQTGIKLPQQHGSQPLNSSGAIPSTAIPSPAVTPNYTLEYVESNVINFEDKFEMMTRLFTDRFFATALFQTVRMQWKNSPIFVYYNNYQGQFSFVDVYAGKTKEPVNSLQKAKAWFKTKILGRTVQKPKHLGVCHGDELPLLFKYSEGKVKENTKDYEMSRDLVKLWVEFASTKENPRFRNVSWPPAEVGRDGTNNVLQFSNEPSQVKLLTHVFAETQRFWDGLQFLAPFHQ